MESSEEAPIRQGRPNSNICDNIGSYFATNTTNSNGLRQHNAGNDDLLTEILRRLPVISLLRFKSVSKHWLSLITHPHFSILHNPNANLPSGFFLRTIYGHEELHPDLVPITSPPPFSWLNLSSPITILSSWNGLICCGNISSRCRSNFYVYNPSNQKFAIIPRSGWFVRYRVDLSSMLNTYPEMILENRGNRGQLIYGCFPLYVLEGERNVDSYMLLYIPGKIVRYNFVDKTFKLIFDYDPPSNVDYFLSYHLWSGAFPFIASLACV